MRSPYSTRQIKKTFARLPLAAQFVLALSALIAAGFAVAIGMIWERKYEETHGAFMPLLIGGAVVIASVTAFLVWEDGADRRRHARFTAEDMQSAVENGLDLDDTADHEEWDLFLAWPIDDSYLDSVRQRCLQIGEEDDPEPDEAVRQELEKILQELRSRVRQ